MANHDVPILGWATVPDSSGDVFFQPYDNVAANDLWKGLVLTFNDTATKLSVHGRFTVPQNYIGTAKLVIQWTTTAITGDVEWEFAYRPVGGNDTESFDQATALEDLASGNNDTAPSATDEKMEYLITLTSGNFAAGDEVEFIFSRDGTDAGDTIAAAVHIFQLLFRFADA